jgi:hypothetical protein
VNLEHAPLGFSARSLVFADVPDVKGLGYDNRTGPAFYQRVREHLLATPGIEAVTLASSAPLLGYSTDHVLAEGETPSSDGHGTEAPYAVVDERYFSTLMIPLCPAADSTRGSCRPPGSHCRERYLRASPLAGSVPPPARAYRKEIASSRDWRRAGRQEGGIASRRPSW